MYQDMADRGAKDFIGNIIADGVPEIEAYMKEVLPDPEAEKRFKEELLEIVPDASQFPPDIA